MAAEGHITFSELTTKPDAAEETWREARAGVVRGWKPWDRERKIS